MGTFGATPATQEAKKRATIIRVERDQVEPRGSTIRKLADALGVEPEELVKSGD